MIEPIEQRNSQEDSLRVATNQIGKGARIMCANMKEFQTVSEKIFELEQKKAKKKKEMDALDKEIKQLKSETSSYMKKRQKNILTVAGLEVLFTAFTQARFDKDAFIISEGEATYNKYLRDIPMERVTVRLAKAQV